MFIQAEDGIRDLTVTGVQTCALPISPSGPLGIRESAGPRSAVAVSVAGGGVGRPHASANVARANGRTGRGNPMAQEILSDLRHTRHFVGERAGPLHQRQVALDLFRPARAVPTEDAAQP